MTLKLDDFELIEDKNVFWRNGYYRTVFKIDVPEGRGYGLDADDVMQITSSNVISGVDIKYFKVSKNISHSKALKYMKNFTINRRFTNASINENDDDDFRNSLNIGRIRHYRAYNQIKSSDDGVAVAYKWVVVIKAISIQKIEEQLDIIRDNWDGVAESSQGREKLKYFELNPETGAQAAEFSKLFDELNVDDKSLYTSTQDNYSGLDFYLVSTLQDDNAFPIGYDTFSTAQNTITFDFVSSTQSKGIIAIPQNAAHEYFFDVRTPNKLMPLASVLAQTCANQFVAENKRVVHFVLNDFSYGDTARVALFSKNQEHIENIDVSKESVNILQGYGRVEDQKMIYERMQHKVSLIFDILQNFQLDISAKSIIEEAVRKAYRKSGKWNIEADLDPSKGKIVNQNPDFYPLLDSVANSLEVVKQEYQEDKLSDLASKTTTLITNLDKVISANKSLLGRKTSLKKPSAWQTYYDFSKVGGSTYKMIQFVNILNYISDSLEAGELLIIHGMNVLDKRIFTEYLKDELQAIKIKGVKILFTFDNTTEADNSSIFELNEGRLFNVFDLDFDWSVIGRVPESETYKIEKLYNQKLSERIHSHISDLNVQGRVLLRRRDTATLHFIDLLPWV